MCEVNILKAYNKQLFRTILMTWEHSFYSQQNHNNCNIQKILLQQCHFFIRISVLSGLESLSKRGEHRLSATNFNHYFHEGQSSREQQAFVFSSYISYESQASLSSFVARLPVNEPNPSFNRKLIITDPHQMSLLYCINDFSLMRYVT